MDFFRFLFLGVIGIAGANFFLYYAIGYMDAAVADLLQFLAPTLVACYMVARGRESLDRPRIVALVMSLAGCALALGAFSKNWAAPPLAMGSALFSAVCFASVLVYGKTLSARYPVWTYLYYGLFAATLFWAVARPCSRVSTCRDSASRSWRTRTRNSRRTSFFPDEVTAQVVPTDRETRVRPAPRYAIWLVVATGS